MRLDAAKDCLRSKMFTMSPDQKGIETIYGIAFYLPFWFTMSPDQKGIETIAAM